MKITICSSLDFHEEINKLSKQLMNTNHEVLIPFTAEMILDGVISSEKIKVEKKINTNIKRVIEGDLIRKHYYKIKESDAILVLNYDKEGIKSYIGGSVFLEIGFAHILEKKIFILNPLPEIKYLDEIKSMQPIILEGDLSKMR